MCYTIVGEAHARDFAVWIFHLPTLITASLLRQEGASKAPAHIAWQVQHRRSNFTSTLSRSQTFELVNEGLR